MINTLEYGSNVLSKFGEILKKDYNKILNGQFAKERGVKLLLYVMRHNLNICIYYLDDRIKFEIDLEQKTILSTYWNIDDVSESVMEYFEFIINDIISDLDKRSRNLDSFSNERRWVMIDKKIDNLCL